MSIPPNNLEQLVAWIRIFVVRTQQKFLKMQKEIDVLQSTPEKKGGEEGKLSKMSFRLFNQILRLMQMILAP